MFSPRHFLASFYYSSTWFSAGCSFELVVSVCSTVSVLFSEFSSVEFSDSSPSELDSFKFAFSSEDSTLDSSLLVSFLDSTLDFNLSTPYSFAF